METLISQTREFCQHGGLFLLCPSLAHRPLAPRNPIGATPLLEDGLLVWSEPLALPWPSSPLQVQATLLNSSPPTHSVPSSTPEPPAINPECCSLSPRFPGINRQALFSLTPAWPSMNQTVGPHPPSLTNSSFGLQDNRLPSFSSSTQSLLYTPAVCACAALGTPEGPSLASSSLAPPPPSSMQSSFSVRWRTHMAPSPAQTLPLTCLVLSTGKLPQFQHAQTELMAFATNLPLDLFIQPAVPDTT